MKVLSPLWRIRSINWHLFDWLIRSTDKPLLKRLNEFENPVLVGGCQRSGTTAVTKVLSSAQEITCFQIGIDNELDGARILAGAVDFKPEVSSRYCFQVTYLNESCLLVGQIQQKYKMVWVVRNPWSVVNSMLFNWRESALDQLYRNCIANEPENSQWRQQLTADMDKDASRMFKACACYCMRSRELLKLAGPQTDGRLFVLDYDLLVSEPSRLLPEMFHFAELTLEQSHIGMLHQNSISKAIDRFSERDRQFIEDMCSPTYSSCLEITTIS